MAKARRRGSRRRSLSSDHVAPAPGREHWRADGAPKVRFDTADAANRAALRLRLESEADLDPYRCGFCNGWHLGNSIRTAGRNPGR